MIREDNRGAIGDTLPPILERLNIDAKQWLYVSTHFESRFKRFVGSIHQLEKACDRLGKRWVCGMLACRQYFSHRIGSHGSHWIYAWTGEATARSVRVAPAFPFVFATSPTFHPISTGQAGLELWIVKFR
jgi:hypothetical protein